MNPRLPLIVVDAGNTRSKVVTFEGGAALVLGASNSRTEPALPREELVRESGESPRSSEDSKRATDSRARAARDSSSLAADLTVLERAGFAHDDSLEAALGAWLDARAPARAAALSCVASPEFEARLAAVLRPRVEGPLFAPPDPGLELIVRHPETVGLDRLFAARGALEGRERAIVVEAGTAVTVDAVERTAAPGRPRFLGGAIAPGPDLLARALSHGGARLPDFDVEPGVPALGRETREALRSGVAVGFVGAARELVRAIAAELEWPNPPVVLSGGAAPFLAELATELGWWRDELLVPRGLALALIDELAGAPAAERPPSPARGEPRERS